MAKSKTAAERSHMQRVAAIPCMICGYHPVELHHPTGAGMGLRSKHTDVIPLCHTHHRTGGYGVAVHAGTKTWEAKYGTQAELLKRLKQMMKE